MDMIRNNYIKTTQVGQFETLRKAKKTCADWPDRWTELVSVSSSSH